MIDYSGWSKQRLFNKIARHLIKQNRRSENASYIDNNGDRCAIGCLVPKKNYRAEDIGSLWSIYNYIYTGQNDSFLWELAIIHDCEILSRWPRKLRKLARKYKLEIPDFLSIKRNNK